MVAVKAANDSKNIWILGHGLSFDREYPLYTNITFVPTWPEDVLQSAIELSEDEVDRLSGKYGAAHSTFAIRVTEEEGGETLIRSAWSSLWLANFLCLVAKSRCLLSVAFSDGEMPAVATAGRLPIYRTIPDIAAVREHQHEWAAKHVEAYFKIIEDNNFSLALRSFGNSKDIFDPQTKLMNMWSGVEALLSIDGEQSRRIALHSTLLLSLPVKERYPTYREIIKQYGLRSRVVHGSTVKIENLIAAVQFVEGLLMDLLRRCVELGRVPERTEFEMAALEGGQIAA